MATKQGWVIGDTAFIPDDGGSSGGLPEVTSADNGKVLTVVNGDWGVADAGGGDVLVVHITTDDGYAVDKTFTEISNAVSAGKAVFAQVNGETFLMAYFNAGFVIFKNYYIYTETNELVYMVFRIVADNTVEVYEYQFQLTPNSD